MPLPTADTIVEHPSGATPSPAVVLHAEQVDGALAVLLDRTAFHPVDAHWPDQPADRGRLIFADRTGADIVYAQVGATDGERLHIGGDVPVRTGTPGWAFVVVHMVASGAPVREGDAAEVEVDAGFRAALSVGHTACHLASLALDRALADGWTKPAATDSLGAPAFDQLAIERSEIVEH